MPTSKFDVMQVRLRIVGVVSGAVSSGAPVVAAALADVVALDAAVAVRPPVDDQRLVDRAAVAVREVDRVVARVQHDRVADVDRAAEELEAVVERAVDLHELDRRAGADGVERDAVQLVAGRHFEARVLDDHVTQEPELSALSLPP